MNYIQNREILRKRYEDIIKGKIGKNLDQARSVVESLEEWSKVLTVCRIFNKLMDNN